MLSGLSAGSEVELGVYDTDDDTNTENESLSWIVLDETKEAVLLISKYPYMKLRYMEIRKIAMTNLRN